MPYSTLVRVQRVLFDNGLSAQPSFPLEQSFRTNAFCLQVPGAYDDIVQGLLCS